MKSFPAGFRGENVNLFRNMLLIWGVVVVALKAVILRKLDMTLWLGLVVAPTVVLLIAFYVLTARIAIRFSEEEVAYRGLWRKHDWAVPREAVLEMSLVPMYEVFGSGKRSKQKLAGGEISILVADGRRLTSRDFAWKQALEVLEHASALGIVTSRMDPATL
jgi:hypothetical protein